MIHKNLNEIIDSIKDVIVEKFPVLKKEDIKPDSLLSAMIEAISIEVNTMYKNMSQIEINNRVSVANKAYLDLIGNSIGAYRQPGQNDDEYRFEIINWFENNRTSSLKAIEKAIRDTDGVYTYSIENLAYGAGTFAVHIQTQDSFSTSMVVNNLYNNIKDVVAEGVLFKVVTPKEVKVDVELMVLGSINQASAAALKSAIRTYVTSIKPGEALHVDKLESVAITSSPLIASAYAMNLRLNGRLLYAKEAKLLMNEQFRISDNNITIRQ